MAPRETGHRRGDSEAATTDGKAVSDVCDAHGLNPTQFYRWQKEFFENGAAAFERTDKRTVQAEQRRHAELEAKLKKKDSVIAEIMEDPIAEKKAISGSRNGVDVDWAGMQGLFHDFRVRGILSGSAQEYRGHLLSGRSGR
ncbi:MAG: transposase [Sedimenticolaceae bacterium]